MNEPKINYADFQIIPPPTRSISYSELRIAPAKFFFSTIAISDLGYPKDVCFLYNKQAHQLVVGASEPNQYTMPFLTDSTTANKTLAICHTALVKALRKHMGWPANKGTYRISGIKIPQKSGADVLLFDLSTAVCGKRIIQKTDPETFLKNCPSALNLRKSHAFVPAMIALPEIPSVQAQSGTIVDVEPIPCD